MSPIKPHFPDIPEAERTPVIDELLELLKWHSDRIEQLEDEIQKLKQDLEIHEEQILEPDSPRRRAF